MDPKQIAKQIVDFNKTAFDNSFNTMSVIQDQAEKMLTATMEQTAFFPEEGKKLVNEWIKNYKKGLEDFKATADENFKKVDSFFASKWEASFLFNKAAVKYRGCFIIQLISFRYDEPYPVRVFKQITPAALPCKKSFLR